MPESHSTELEGTVLAMASAAMYLRGFISRDHAAALAGVSETALDRALEIVASISADPQPVAVTAPRVSLPQGFKLSVLMPVYNELATVQTILDRVLAVDLPKEIIIVDDGSTDGTREHLINQVDGVYSNVRVALHQANRGKGAAIRTAIPLAAGSVCIIQDSDLEYSPDEYPQLLQPILDGRADAVYGSRFVGGGPHRVHLFWHYLGNQALTTLSNMLTNLNLTDMETCYKVIRTDLLQSLKLVSNGFEIEPELTAKLAKARARIYEVPISYSGRDYAEGKKVNWKDGLRALWSIVRYRLTA